MAWEKPEPGRREQPVASHPVQRLDNKGREIDEAWTTPEAERGIRGAGIRIRDFQGT